MQRSRRNHTSTFKAKVAIAAIKVIKPSPNSPNVSTFLPPPSFSGKHSCSNEQLEAFGGDAPKNNGPDVRDLHAKIGQLALENDFLERALGRIDGSSAKR